MNKLLLTKIKAANGFAFPLVLLATILVISLLVAGLAPMITTQAKHVIHTEDQLVARYTAETGVKMGLRQVYDTLSTPVNNVKPQPYEVKTKSIKNESLLSSGGVRYSYKYEYIPGENKPSNPERIEVTASATANKTKADSMAWIVFDSRNIPGYTSPDLIDLVSSANNENEKNCYHWNYSTNNNKPWSFGTNRITGKQYAYPSDGSAENNNYEDSEFKLDYDLGFTKTSGSGGIGVIYGASETDTAYDFNAYCVKFNRSRGAFSVTKYTSQNSGKGKRPVELSIDTDDAGPQSYGTKTDEQAMFQPNGVHPDDKNLPKDKRRTSFNGVDNLGNVIGRSSISFKEVEKKTGVDPDASNANYSIRIETKLEEVTVHKPDGTTYPDKRLRHNIYLKPADRDKYDKEPILSFIDFSDVNPVTTYDLVTYKSKTKIANPQIDLERKKNPNKQIRTGLRCWDVSNCQFSNSDIADDNQSVKNMRRIIWKK